MLDKRKLDVVLEFIDRYTDENGFPPTVRDICAELQIKSTATAYDYVNRLRAMGLLQKTDGKKRAVALANTGTVRVPLIGTVTAGTPILATENYDGYYTLPTAEFSGDNLFLLTVKGDSMIEAGIFNGDKIVVRKQETLSWPCSTMALKKALPSNASFAATENSSFTRKTAYFPITSSTK